MTQEQPADGYMFVTVDGKWEQRPYHFKDGIRTPETHPGEHLSSMVGGGFFITRVRAE